MKKKNNIKQAQRVTFSFKGEEKENFRHFPFLFQTRHES
jgi:hypothetical protein